MCLWWFAFDKCAFNDSPLTNLPNDSPLTNVPFDDCTLNVCPSTILSRMLTADTWKELFCWWEKSCYCKSSIKTVPNDQHSASNSDGIRQMMSVICYCNSTWQMIIRHRGWSFFFFNFLGNLASKSCPVTPSTLKPRNYISFTKRPVASTIKTSREPFLK